MLTEEQQDKLRKYFYGEDGFVLVNPSKLKSKFKDVPVKDLVDWYNSQELTQVMRPAPVVTEKEKSGEAFKPIVAWFPFQRFYMDTVFINRYKLVIVVGLDLFSRYGFAKVYYGDREQGISSKKALEALLDFLSEIKDLGYTVEKGAVWTDDGSEFKGVFRSYLKEKGVEQVVSKAHDPRKNRNVERFNKTLRSLIEKFAYLYGKKISRKNVQKLVDGYNNTEHSSLVGLTPYQALKDLKLSRQLYYHYVDLKWANKDKEESDVLPNGTWCRWFIREGLFKKTGKNWSKTLYQVSGYDPKTKSYTLEGLKKKHLRREYLQVVDKELFDKYNYIPERVVEQRDRNEGRRQRKGFRLNRDELEVINQPVLTTKRVRKGVERLDL